MKPPRLSLRTSAPLTVAMMMALAGCGGDSNNETSARPPSTGPNELLKVSAKVVARTERPSTYGEDTLDAGTSGIEIEPTAEVTAADREAAKLMPDVDGWDSERLSALAAERLKALSKPLADIDFSTLAADGFTSSGLVPSNVEVSTLAGEIQMIEGVAFEAQGKSLADELNQLRDRVGGETVDGLTIHFKMVGVDLTDADGSTFATTVLVDVGATAADGAVSQIDASWLCTWINNTQDGTVLLQGIEVERYRELHAPARMFADATRSAFVNAPGFAEQMMHSCSYWAERLTRVDDMAITGHHGIAVGDVNGDGLEDVYVCDGGGLPNRLYMQAADGTLTDQSAGAQVDFLEDSRSALIVDLDNDGDQDLVVGTVALVLFAENDGTGKFSLKGGHPGSPGPYSMTTMAIWTSMSLPMAGAATPFPARRDSKRLLPFLTMMPITVAATFSWRTTVDSASPT